MPAIRIALIGDYSPAVTAHRAIPPSLELASQAVGVAVEPVWVHTSRLAEEAELRALLDYQGIWCVPASPYANTEGAIAAIALARTNGIPFLGTCGGFQHALLDYFRNVAGVADAAHAELDPEAARPVIAKLSCSLVEATGAVYLAAGSLSQRLYGADSVEESYRCNYGLNPEFTAMLRRRGELRIEGMDSQGEIRIVRLETHPFFMGTLFQPERSSLKGQPHPLIREFVSAGARRQAG